MAFVFLGLTCLLSLCVLFALDLLSFASGLGGWRRFLTTFLLFYAQIIGTEFVLGVTNFLYSYSLAACNLLLAVTVVLALRQKHGLEIFMAYAKNLRSWPAAFKTEFGKDRLLIALCALAGVFILWLFFLGAIFPPIDWDGNSYHLTYVADLVQNHNLYDVPASLPWLPGYPKAGELIQAWTVLLAHNDTFADLSQLPFVILGIASLYALCRNFNASRRRSLFGALLFLFTPVVIAQSTTAYVDVLLCAIFFASLALTTQKKYSKLDFLLIGITFSLLIGIKSSGIFFVALLCTWLFVQLVKTHGKQCKRYVQPIILITLPAIFGLYWYVKNWVLYGSPVYPFGLIVHGRTLFVGADYAKWSYILTRTMPHSYAARWVYAWAERGPDPNVFRYDYDASYVGLGILWFIVMLPAAITALVIALRKRNYRMLCAFALIVSLLVIYPVSFSPRYGIFGIALGVLSTAYLLGFLTKYTTVIVKSLLILLAILTISLNPVPQHTLGDLSYQIKGIVHHTNLHGYDTPYSRGVGDVYQFAHNLVQPGQTIAYADGPFIYPLWNGNFSDKVIYVPGKSEDDWYRNLINSKANYVLIRTDPSADSNDVFDYSQNQHQDVWAMRRLHNVLYDKYGYEIIKVR